MGVAVDEEPRRHDISCLGGGRRRRWRRLPEGVNVRERGGPRRQQPGAGEKSASRGAGGRAVSRIRDPATRGGDRGILPGHAVAGQKCAAPSCTRTPRHRTAPGSCRCGLIVLRPSRSVGENKGAAIHYNIFAASSRGQDHEHPRRASEHDHQADCTGKGHRRRRREHADDHQALHRASASTRPRKRAAPTGRCCSPRPAPSSIWRA